MAEAVLDASAVLAFLKGEPGGEAVENVLPRSLLSAVNAAEVITRLIDRGAAADFASEIVGNLPCEVVGLDRQLGFRAGELREITRPLGLALGDQACLALAEREGLPAITADRGWSKLGLGIDIRLIR